MLFSPSRKSNISIRFLYPSLLCLLMSCGGSTQNNTEKSQIVEPPLLTDTAAPIADVLFPWSLSRTESAYIKINGTANDESGIKEIRVNGIIAEITTLNDKEANWHAEVPSARELVVVTEDILGNVNREADKIVILSDQIPVDFTIDDLNQRLIGRHADLDKIITVDLNTNKQEIITLNSELTSGKLAYSNQENMLLHIEKNDDLLIISSLDLNTGSSNVLYNYTIGNTSGFLDWFELAQVDLAQDENALYILVNHISLNESHESLILKYDLSANILTTFVDGATTTGEVIYTDLISYTNNGLLIANQTHLSVVKYSYDGIFNLGADGTNITRLTPASTNPPKSMTVDTDNNIAYLIEDEGVVKINLATSSKEVFSPEAEENELSLSQITSSDIDFTNEQLLIKDNDLDMIVAVDLNDGERKKFIHNDLGSGKPLLDPLNFVLDEENAITYVATSNNNDSYAVLSVDLTTGDRLQIADIETNHNEWIEDLVFDSNSNTLYAIFNKEIKIINLTTQQTEIFTGEITSTGGNTVSLRGATLDNKNNRLLIVDAENSSIIAVDLTTGEYSLISSEIAAIGTGEAMGWVSSIGLDVENNSAFVLSQTKGVIYIVDLHTGNRELLLDTCLNSSDENMMKELSQTHKNLYFDPATQDLYITADTLLKYNAIDKSCKATDFQRIFDVAVTKKGQVLATSDGTLLQLDFETGDKVIIAK